MGSHAVQDTHIILAAVPGYGHVRPFRLLAKILTAHGYPVSFITGSNFRESIEAIPGVDFVQLQGKADIDADHLEVNFPERFKLDGVDRILYDGKTIFFEPLPGQFNALKSVLDRPDLADRKVLIIQDPTFMGTFPIHLDSPQIRKVPVIGVGHFPLMLTSKDAAPFGTGVVTLGEEKNLEANKQVIQMFSSVRDYAIQLLEPFECKKDLPEGFIFSTLVHLPDLYLQLCVPALEPFRSDLPSNVRFCGTLAGGNDKKPQPEWFDDFVLGADRQAQPLILVTSGTLMGKVTDLILPTIEACKDLPVRLVVCGVNIPQPENFELPENVRWAKWIAFEEIFPHTSVMVSNGGYGGISQAFSAGIPMVLAGMTEDKIETNLRASQTGAAINLQTQTAGVDAMRAAVQSVLQDKTYREKALELKEAYAACDAVGSVFDAIAELSK